MSGIPYRARVRGSPHRHSHAHRTKGQKPGVLRLQRAHKRAFISPHCSCESAFTMKMFYVKFQLSGLF